MKFLIDENLPPRLTRSLADVFPNMHHVRDLNLKAADNSELWDFAIVQGYAAILTADADFQNKVLELGQPPKVIRIANCNFSAHEIIGLLRRDALRITDFLSSPNPLLVLRR